MRQIAYRLRPGELLKESIEQKAIDESIGAGVLLSIVGGVKKAVLRMAGSEAHNSVVKTWDDQFEIVAGTGTISKDGCHIHVALSDRDGKVIGGHLKDGCIVEFTCEIVVGIFDDVVFERRADEDTKFNELNVIAV
ncbi:MAG: DNA-binding protein [Candidatus Uhrbacteria bacterium]|nr:DNA-binding protein [Candidatus Uhrbacteria bacterium]